MKLRVRLSQRDESDSYEVSLAMGFRTGNRKSAVERVGLDIFGIRVMSRKWHFMVQRLTYKCNGCNRPNIVANRAVD